MTLVSLSCHLLGAEEVVERVLANVVPATQLHSDENSTLPLHDKGKHERTEMALTKDVGGKKLSVAKDTTKHAEHARHAAKLGQQILRLSKSLGGPGNGRKHGMRTGSTPGRQWTILGSVLGSASAATILMAKARLGVLSVG